MTARWTPGQAVIDRLLAEGRLERVLANRQLADEYLRQASAHLATSRLAAGTDAVGEFQLAYDAARKALAAILVNQGIRPTSKGGHVVVERAAFAQLGASHQEIIKPFSWMRPLRNDSEYPSADRPVAASGDAEEARRGAQGIVDAAVRLLDEMGPYG